MKRLPAWCAGAWFALLAALPAAAQAPALGLPLACAPGADCWIANHVDHDAGPGRRDYACGTLTYDAHNGTDFALRDLAALEEGVRVLAAAAGVVRGRRDGVADVSVRELPPGAVKGRECGNGVRIDHGGGWQTQYCHLRSGSIAVRPGERVEAGQALGLVGLSGLTEYPHLHFTLSRDGRVVDPFRGEAPGCGAGAQPLWDAATQARLPYAPGTIYNFGVAPRRPEPAAARAGKLRGRSLPRDAASIVVWAEVFATAAGDALSVAVETPEGASFLAQRAQFERAQARVFRAFGRQRGAAPWSPGTYRVTIALDRGAGAPPAMVRFSFEVQ